MVLGLSLGASIAKIFTGFTCIANWIYLYSILCESLDDQFQCQQSRPPHVRITLRLENVGEAAQDLGGREDSHCLPGDRFLYILDYCLSGFHTGFFSGGGKNNVCEPHSPRGVAGGIF